MNNATVSTWVNIPGDCGMTAHVHASNDIVVTIDAQDQPLEFVFQGNSLQQFTALATDVLGKRPTDDDQGDDTPPAVSSDKA